MRLKRLALLMAIVMVALACSNCLSSPVSGPPAQPGSSPPPAAALTEQQKEKAIAIALNDYSVNDEIGALGSRGLHPSTVFLDRRAKDVVMSSYRGTSPGDNNTTHVMPAVIIVTGNESEDGVNVHAFVDLGEERVAYIGYVPRHGLTKGAYNYTATDFGVRAHYVYMGDYHDFYNDTIVDTGYPFNNKSKQEMLRPEIINITLNDPAVKSKLDGRRYEVNGIVETGSEYFIPRYTERYPTVSINVVDVGKITAAVNLKTKKVVRRTINYLDDRYPYPF